MGARAAGPGAPRGEGPFHAGTERGYLVAELAPRGLGEELRCTGCECSITRTHTCTRMHTGTHARLWEGRWLLTPSPWSPTTSVASGRNPRLGGCAARGAVCHHVQQSCRERETRQLTLLMHCPCSAAAACFMRVHTCPLSLSLPLSVPFCLCLSVWLCPHPSSPSSDCVEETLP